MSDNENVIRGYLYGSLCSSPRIWDRIRDARIIATQSNQNVATVDSLARNLDRQPRQVVEILDPEAVADLPSDAMRATTDAEGRFEFKLSEEYKGDLLDLVAIVDRVPTPTLDQDVAKLPREIHISLGTVRPIQFDTHWNLISVIPMPLWCHIRALADMWVIVGRVETSNGAQGIGNVTVRAFDRDIVQDDQLGTDTTSSTGLFRIDYPGSNFRQGTIFDVELIGGPDVYFEVEDSDGNLILDEPASRGRSVDRRDRSHCFCVHLRSEIEAPPDEAIPGVWTGIGTAFTIPDTSSLNSFNAEGYAGAAEYGLTSVIRGTGSAPRISNGNNVEYRFLVSDATTSNGVAPPAPASFSRIVGTGTDVNLFASIRLGQMVRLSPFRIVNVDSQLVDVDGDGWLDVNAAIERTFLAHPTLTPADLGDFDWVDSDGLMGIDTRNLTIEPNVPGGITPGDPVPPSDRIAIEKKALRFEIREVIDKSLSLFVTMPGSGVALNSAVMNNNPAHIGLAMADHLTGTSCDPLSGSPDVAYTVHHPHLRSVNIQVVSNDGSYNNPVSDGSIPIAGNTSALVNHANNGTAALAAGLHKCSYITTLGVRRRLHTGDSAVAPNNPQVSFYYEP
jgi:hypothetical protein